jgi:hypothetical protein
MTMTRGTYKCACGEEIVMGLERTKLVTGKEVDLFSVVHLRIYVARLGFVSDRQPKEYALWALRKINCVFAEDMNTGRMFRNCKLEYSNE